MASMQKRLQKELLALRNDPPPGMTLNERSVQNTITEWFIDMDGAPGTLYEGEKFQLLFKFSSRYPFDSPQVMFTGENIPVHPHIYSNGHICLSILTEDWSPALSVQSVCLSIISMLSSCKEKVSVMKREKLAAPGRTGLTSVLLQSVNRQKLDPSGIKQTRVS
ncbi:Ubiquitin-conjugating enzyme E2 W [Bagarius yarrelli]|uniref:N-terminal E2 ubiquitin-conjugating enzyme n=1 Tax=Bagarius yarrelli TaxID=175774 RepID=A0A556U6I6_BAGYA|nr:Ubiquitin-conjugating enzyme E2 W [Bagarius yarrelli]